MYFKKNWGSMAEKDLSLGRIDIFQTSHSREADAQLNSSIQRFAQADLARQRLVNHVQKFLLVLGQTAL